MNLKLWASCGAIIASATFAQDASYTQTAPVQGVQMVPVQTAQGIQMMPVAQPVQGNASRSANANADRRPTASDADGARSNGARRSDDACRPAGSRNANASRSSRSACRRKKA